jgi:DNA processing protein
MVDDKEQNSEEVRTITISFKQLSSKPVKLYYLGQFDQNVLSCCVAVVGTRRITEYGKVVIKKLVASLVESGKVIVSGLMYGVDQYVHRECLKYDAKTIAVLGWGINWTGTGEEEKNLIAEIVAKGGVVVSEWWNERSTLWMFPHRDRIMAAMASDIYVVEGALKSGSLITAEWGRKLGKTVWAVPGPVTSKVSEGTNWLIASGRAKMWLPEQQLAMNLDKDMETRSISNIHIYRMLQNEPLTVDELVIKIRKPAQEIGAELTLMVLKGEIIEREGKYYVN